MPQSNKYQGRTALVTGASVGIGKSIACHLLDQGCNVISISRRPLEIDSDRLTSICLDLSDNDAVRSCAEELSSTRAIDILVNNAGVVRNTPIEDVTDAEFDMLNDIHLRAAITLTQAVLPNMKKQGFGRIVNMSSRAVVGLANRTVYAGTKAAIIAMTRAWALELGPSGITVNAIAPGPVVTDMLTADIPENSETFSKLSASLPTRRLGTADDIARATLFFADPENSWVTGQTLFVCGGASLGSLTAL